MQKISHTALSMLWNHGLRALYSVIFVSFFMSLAGCVPVIGSFSPVQGQAGATVIITGMNFTNISAVTFNGKPAGAFTVNSPAQITATIPAGATSGPIAITNPDGTAASLLSFTVSSNPQAWKLAWSDEFNQANGSGPDGTKWTMETGGGGWGNNELQTYTNRTQNAQIQNSNLIITAKKENFTGSDGITRNYTSARLKTAGKFEQTYGRFEARMKIPYGQGIWPAFWMLGNDIGSVNWPTCGEIDIMENIGKEPSTIHGTIHGPGYSGGAGISAAYSLNGARFSDDYHIFAIEWEQNVIRFYIDDHLYATRTPVDLPFGTAWKFNHPFFMILNVAVGGGWPGNPDGTTIFPQQMLVDYVRVYKRA